MISWLLGSLTFPPHESCLVWPSICALNRIVLFGIGSHWHDGGVDGGQFVTVWVAELLQAPQSNSKVYTPGCVTVNWFEGTSCDEITMPLRFQMCVLHSVVQPSGTVRLLALRIILCPGQIPHGPVIETTGLPQIFTVFEIAELGQDTSVTVTE